MNDYIKVLGIVVIFLLASASESMAQSNDIPEDAPIDYNCSYEYPYGMRCH